MAPAAPKVDGVSSRANWRAEVTDLMALVRAVSAGQVPITALQANTVFLGQQARSLKGLHALRSRLATPEPGHQDVDFVFGAPGAGKSVVAEAGIPAGASALYEGTLQRPERAAELADAALEAGLSPKFDFVHADPGLLAARIARRADGIRPSAGEIADRYLGSLATVRHLLDRYGDRVGITLTDNSFEQRPTATVTGADAVRAGLERLAYTGSRDELRDEIQRGFDVAAAQGAADPGNSAQGHGAAEGRGPGRLQAPSGPRQAQQAGLVGWLQKLYNLPAWTPYKQVVGNHLAALQRSAIENDREVNAFRKMVPDADRRSAITRYLEAGGDDGVLARRAEQAANAGLPDSAAQHQAARNLTPGELAAAAVFRSRMDEMLAAGQKAKAISGAVQDYVPHLWKRLPADKASGVMSKVGYEAGNGLLDTSLDAARKRILGSLHEGEMLGLEPQTTDFSQLYGLYRRFSALATVAYDDATHTYRFRAYNDGRYLDTVLTTRGSRRLHCGQHRREKSAKFRRADRPRQTKRRGPDRLGLRAPGRSSVSGSPGAAGRGPVPINVTADGFSWGYTTGPARIVNTMHLTASGAWSEVTEVAVGGHPPQRSVTMLLQHEAQPEPARRTAMNGQTNEQELHARLSLIESMIAGGPSCCGAWRSVLHSPGASGAKARGRGRLR